VIAVEIHGQFASDAKLLSVLVESAQKFRIAEVAADKA